MSILNHNGPSQSHRRHPGIGSSGQSGSLTFAATQPVVPNPNERARSIPVGSLRPQEVVSAIQTVLNEFDAGRISKASATSQIFAALKFDGTERDDTKEVAFRSYLDQLDHIEAAQRREPSDEGTPTRKGSPVQDSQPGSESRPSPRPHLLSDRQRGKRPEQMYRFDPDEDDDEGGGSEGEGEPPRKHLRESDMPWFGKQEAEKGGRWEQVENCRLLRLYGEDVNQVKRWILTSPAAPPGFPPFHQVLPATFGGQSLRSGGATWLASTGAAAATIQTLGRWSSDAWKRYIRKHPFLIHQL